MKKFCVLEQGATVGDSVTLLHKRQFTTGVSDFYRLNWKNPNDENADIYVPNISPSEGRCVLYDYVPKNYEYYIFIDDDVDFKDGSIFKTCRPSSNLSLSHISDIAYRIAEILSEYNPICATFECPGASGMWHLQGVQSGKKVHPIAGFDGAVCIFSRSFAEVMLPAIYHGAAKAHWYATYTCHNLFPKKQLIFRNIKTKNSRSTGAVSEAEKKAANGDPLYKKFTPPENIINKFEENLYTKQDFSKWNDLGHVQQLNVRGYNLEPDKTKIDFDIYDLAKIYDINNKDFKNRKPTLR